MLKILISTTPNIFANNNKEKNPNREVKKKIITLCDWHSNDETVMEQTKLLDQLSQLTIIICTCPCFPY